MVFRIWRHSRWAVMSVLEARGSTRMFATRVWIGWHRRTLESPWWTTKRKGWWTMTTARSTSAWVATATSTALIVTVTFEGVSEATPTAERHALLVLALYRLLGFGLDGRWVDFRWIFDIGLLASNLLAHIGFG